MSSSPVTPPPASVLVFAGREPLQYAGLEADLRHLQALGCPGVGVPTAHTVQAMDRVVRITPVEPGDVTAQGLAEMASGSIAAVKIGMLHRAGIVRAVARVLEDFGGPIVLDPVLAATSGEPLLDEAGREALLAILVPRVAVITPNLPELRLLVPGSRDAAHAAERLLDLGARAVLVKGGHGEGPAEDLLVTREGTRRFTGPRHQGPSPRGTGCALSTALAVGLARGVGLADSVEAAKAIVGAAIAAAQELGTRFLVLRPRSFAGIQGVLPFLSRERRGRPRT